jgi:hypothetical protein
MRSKVLLATGAGNGSLMAFLLPEAAGLMKDELLTHSAPEMLDCYVAPARRGSPRSDLRPLRIGLAASAAGPMIAHDDMPADTLALAAGFIPLSLLGGQPVNASRQQTGNSGSNP